MSKVLYTVWYDVDSEVVADWVTWMGTTHIPSVIRSGDFIGAKRCRVVEGSPARYVTFYEAKDSASLKKYLDGPAKKLREDYRWPGFSRQTTCSHSRIMPDLNS